MYKFSDVLEIYIATSFRVEGQPNIQVLVTFLVLLNSEVWVSMLDRNAVEFLLHYMALQNNNLCSYLQENVIPYIHNYSWCVCLCACEMYESFHAGSIVTVPFPLAHKKRFI
jgi:hypothetical protein